MDRGAWWIHGGHKESDRTEHACTSSKSKIKAEMCLFDKENGVTDHFCEKNFPGEIRTSSVQFSSVAQSCLTLCDPRDCSMPGLPVHHQLLDFTQTNVHQVGDAIQPSHPLSSPSPPAPNPSQHQGLLQ